MAMFQPPSPLMLCGNVAENWKKFKQRFLLYLEALGSDKMSEKRKVAILLTVIGDESVEVYNTFTFEDANPKLDDVIAEFEKYCLPIKNIVFERYKFYSISQKEGQSVDAYVTELKKAASSCEFKEEEEMIRDRLVLGIRDNVMQERMLRESNLTLKKAAEFCRAYETSQNQVKELQSSVEAINVQGRPSMSSISKSLPQVVPKTTPKNGFFLCRNCGNTHKARNCPAFNKNCALCKNKNHFAKCCPNKDRLNYGSSYRARSKSKKVNEVVADSVDLSSSEDVASSSDFLKVEDLFVDSLENKLDFEGGSARRPRSWFERIEMNGSDHVLFKLDSGSEANVLPLKTYKQLKKMPQLSSTPTVLVGFNQTPVKPIGKIVINCSSRNISNVKVEFIVADVQSVPLLGLTACIQLKLIERVSKSNVDSVSVNSKEKIVNEYKDVFVGLGKFPGQIEIKLKPNAEPKVFPPRRIPLSLHDNLKKTLDGIEKQGIVSKVSEPTEWVQNLVIVEKPNGNLRLCLDPREMNKNIMREHYLIPKAEEILNRLSGKKVFSVLDMKEGFWHIRLSESSSLLTTFNTPFGRYKFNVLPYGLCSAPEIFQKHSQEIFGDIEGCEVYFDDILICAKNDQEHDSILKKVFDRAREKNVKFNLSKFQYKVSEVKFLGQVVSGNGIRPNPDHVRAIVEMERPQNKKELLRFLGMTKYVSQYIPNLSTLSTPLRHLTKNNSDWQWFPEHEKSFCDLKNKLVTAPALAIFDSSKTVTLQVDASKDGLGACLLQNGKPVGFASRSLTDAETRYAQIEKELLAIVFGFERFHQLTYGRLVNVQTDHKPLVSVVEKDVCKVSARLQRLLLRLLKYQFKLTYVPGKLMFLADTLSRSFLKDPVKDDIELSFVVHTLCKYVPMSEERKKEFVKAVDEDEVFVLLKKYHLLGWPKYKNMCPEHVQPYFNLKQDINFEGGLLFLNDKVLVPTKLRLTMLKKIHESHLGIEKCKLLARQVLYWPNMSKDIEYFVLKCQVCEKYRRSNVREPMLSHPVPSRPWERISADILQFGTKDYLVVIDSFSRWLELCLLKGKTAIDVINVLKPMFAKFGPPDVLLSDNMPFGSSEFKKFANDWNFNTVTISPLHSQSNGLAEKSVSIAKNILRKCYESKQDINVALMLYRNTPLKDTKLSPAQIMLGRAIKTTLPTTCSFLKPVQVDAKEVHSKLVRKNLDVKNLYDRSSQELPPLNEGDNVMIKCGKVWEPGIVVRKHEAPRSYIVKQVNGNEVRRNRKFLRRTLNKVQLSSYENLDPFPNEFVGPNHRVDHSTPTVQPNPPQTPNLAQPQNHPDLTVNRSRFGRVIKRPVRFYE